jgi:hypothetical protein
MPPGNRINILKRGNKVTRRRDLRPAQPVVRQREGTSKERNYRKDYRSQRRKGATQQQSSSTRKAKEH